MVQAVQTLLLNLLFLVVFLLYVPLFIETNFKKISEARKEMIITVCSGMAIISCMTFPLYIHETLIIDLRWVPVIVAGLIFGRITGGALIGTVILYRSLIGIGPAFYWTIFIGLCVFLLIALFSPIYRNASKKQKVFIGTSLSLFTSVIIHTVLLFPLKVSFDLTFTLYYSFLYSISTLFILYFMENMRETLYVNQQILKAEKLDIVSHLASSISHEVRNPLTVVKGFLQMLINHDVTEEKKREFLKLSLEEIERANFIIGNYLTFAKPVPDKVEIMDIKQELERAVNIIVPLANMSCVEIEAKISNCHINGVPQLFQQCMLNIFKNCIEAMVKNGKLSVKTFETDRYIEITIIDNGAGMTKEQLARIGEPYYTTKGREGTGLGLMAAIQIIDMMNGQLKVNSEVNKGTQFTITFPKVTA